MPRKHNPVPTYRRQRRKGKADLAFVDFNGVRRYLGERGSDESRAEYARLIAEHRTGGTSPLTEPDGLTAAELVAAFWTHAERHYGKPSGGTTSEIDCYRQAVRPLVRLYGDTSAAAFGPRSLKAIHQAMIDTGRSCRYVNSQVARIKRGPGRMKSRAIRKPWPRGTESIVGVRISCGTRSQHRQDETMA